MKKHLTLQIKDVRSINQANIELNKINVIGGVNGSGKSTVSKIFYSFLKANSEDRRDYLHQELIDDFNRHIEYLNDEGIDADNVPDSLTLEDDYSVVNEKYEKILEIFKKHESIIDKQREELSISILEKYNECIDKLEDRGVNVDSFRSFNEVNDIFNKDFVHDFKKLMIKNDLEEYSKDLDNLRLKFSNTNRFKFRKRSFEKIKIGIEAYFTKEDDSSISDLVMRILFVNESLQGSFLKKGKSESKINFSIDSENNNAFEYFFKNGFINQVFYIDNVSILDFEEFNSKNMPLHKSELIDNLFAKEFKFPTKQNESDEFKNILDKIEEIINGEYFFEGHIFNTRIPFEKESGNISFTDSDEGEPRLAVIGDNISSGIKQIGIIQILLLNNKLKKDSYLILDEPEVNLHPKWQFKFAEILVLLAKELNITLYINSHSPMFIEALDAFCEFYDFEEEINYYLTQKSDVEFKYDFIKINSNELYKIYDNLGSPYKLINQLKLRKRYNK